MTPAEQAARALDQCSRAAHMNESEQSACCQCVAAAIAQARREEREACAKIAARKAGDRCAAHEWTGEGACGSEIAAAIRARAEESEG